MCKVSVIIPYYNNEKTIIRALNSVINQTFKDFEIMIIDDGSTDKSHELVEQFILQQLDYEITHLYQKNSGPSKARNACIKLASGDYVALLDSDDSWCDTKLEKQIAYLEKHKEIAILGSDYYICNEENKMKTKSKESDAYKEANFYSMLVKHFFITPTVIIKRDVLVKNDLFFPEWKKYSEDVLLYLNIARKYKGGKICTPLTKIYKEIYGVGGLSKFIKETEKCEQENFNLLYKENISKEKKINFALLVFVKLFSYIKYFRRVVIVNVLYKFYKNYEET